MATNLQLADDDLLDWLVKNDVGFCSSLDGPKELHDYNRPLESGAGSYDLVTSKIKHIKEKFGYIVPLLMVTTRQSFKYYKELIDEYLKFENHDIQIKYINKLGFARGTWDRVGYSVEEFIEFYRNCLDYMFELTKEGKLIRDRYAVLILEKLVGGFDPNFMDFRSPCGIVSGQLAYNFDGKIYACDEGRNFDLFKIGDVVEDTYDGLIHKDESKELVSCSMTDNYLCNNCVYKPYCGVCPVLSYAESGNIINTYNSSRCKINKFLFEYLFDKLINSSAEDEEVIRQWVSSR